MPLFIGAALALAVGAYAWWIGFDRDRAFYSVVLIVVASYYVLFSVMGGDAHTTVAELSISAIFVIAASLGFRRSMWLVAAGLAAHGIMDLFHGALVSNPGVPRWWPLFCSAYDVTAAAFLAVKLRRNSALPTRPKLAARPVAER
jgi:hypothetical protein